MSEYVEDTIPNHEERRDAGSKRAQMLELLNASKDKNFVFLFGAPNSGKTIVIGSILQAMQRADVNGKLFIHGAAESGYYRSGAALWESIRKHFREQRFPPRTDVANNTIQLHVQYQPSKGAESTHIVFLETAGENFRSVPITNGVQTLPFHLAQFLAVPDIKIMFLIVTAWDQVDKDRDLIVDFVNYINEQAPGLSESRIMLLVTKWDSYPERHEMSVEQFVRGKMSDVFQKIGDAHNVMRSYSVGKVIKVGDGEEDIIAEFDHAISQRLFARIYETFTGVSAEPRKSWWQRFFD